MSTTRRSRVVTTAPPATALPSDTSDAQPFLAALRPVAKALGASIVPPARMRGSDIPLEWGGAVVGALRLPDLQGELKRMIARVERELGGPLGGLSREDKQRAVKLLEERGAFALRKSIEDIADAMGVSRITVYNYLNAVAPRPIERTERTERA